MGRTLRALVDGVGLSLLCIAVIPIITLLYWIGIIKDYPELVRYG